MNTAHFAEANRVTFHPRLSAAPREEGRRHDDIQLYLRLSPSRAAGARGEPGPAHVGPTVHKDAASWRHLVLTVVEGVKDRWE